MFRIQQMALALLLLLLAGASGCGVKGDPVPYVTAEPEPAKKVEAPVETPAKETKSR